MSIANCAHEHMKDDAPIDLGDGTVTQGYVCADCGFQTVRAETYVPVSKSCCECGRQFEGMPDVANERCDDCFRDGLDKWIEQLNHNRGI